MKKKTLFFIYFALFALVSNAQFEVRETDSDQLISDGQTLNFSESGSSYSADYNWKFKVINTSSEAIYIRIFVDEMVNSDGSNFQLCFANVCLNSISIGSGYPSTPVQIEPGTTNVAGNSMWNQNPSGTSTPMSWTFRFQAFNAIGLPIGAGVVITYNFDPNLGLEDAELTSVKIYPTRVKNELTVSTNQNLTARFYNVLGKKIKQVAILSGESKIDVRNLAPQLYIIRFTGQNGNTTIRKVIVE